MRRLLQTLLVTCTFVLLLGAQAFAGPHDGGQGLIGEADDKKVTDAGFIIIGAIPLFILTMSLIQWRLDKRKYARKAAAKGRATNTAWKTGW